VHRPLFDGAKEFGWTRRIYVVEDVGCAFAVALVGGVRPSAYSSCRYVAIVQLVLLAAHLVYVVARRPYASRLEQAFAVVLSAVNVSIAAAVAALTFSSYQDNADVLNGDSRLLQVIAWGSMLTLVLVVAQMVILAVLEIRDATAAPPRRAAAASDSADDGSASPLLQVPAVVSSRLNPLTQP
jgi:hypothetical protein